jgi:hypothetical protein
MAPLAPLDPPLDVTLRAPCFTVGLSVDQGDGQSVDVSEKLSDRQLDGQKTGSSYSPCKHHIMLQLTEFKALVCSAAHLQGLYYLLKQVI